MLTVIKKKSWYLSWLLITYPDKLIFYNISETNKKCTNTVLKKNTFTVYRRQMIYDSLCLSKAQSQ